MFRLGHPVQQVHLHFVEISVPDLFDHCAYERNSVVEWKDGSEVADGHCVGLVCCWFHAESMWALFLWHLVFSVSQGLWARIGFAVDVDINSPAVVVCPRRPSGQGYCNERPHCWIA